MRLDYFIAHATGLSRRDVRRSILAGDVTVDGIEKPRADTQLSGQAVWFRGVQLEMPGERYLMLHKPAGYVSSTSDRDGPSVLQLIPPSLHRGLHLVGRLDADTTGLLLLTTDGDWSHRITSPTFACPKVYRVTVAHDLDARQLAQLEVGVLLRGEAKVTLPARVEVLSARVLLLEIQEGKYHQVKRMLAAVGNQVIALHRVRIGALSLPDTLGEGCWQTLTGEQVALFALSQS